MQESERVFEFGFLSVDLALTSRDQTNTGLSFIGAWRRSSAVT